MYVCVFAIFRQADPVQLKTMTRPDHNTGNYVPYPMQEECGFFNAPANQYRVYAEDGAYVYRSYLRR